MNDHELDERVAATAPTVPDLSRVDLYDAQQELLAEISRHERGRRRPLAAALVAAAVVLVLAVVPAVLMGGRDRSHQVRSDPATNGSAVTASAVRAANAGPRLLFDAPGWRLEYLDGSSMAFHRGPADVTRVVPGGMDTSLAGALRRAQRSGTSSNPATSLVARGARLEIDWYPASSYAGYRADRDEVSSVRQMPVLGSTGDVVTYERGDYAVMTRPAHGIFVEIRASGLTGRPAFRRILARLRQVDARTWLASLPASAIVPTEDAAATVAILKGVPVPAGLTPRSLTPAAASTYYQYAAYVTGAVTCTWIKDWERARAAGDSAARQRAVDALATASTWPALARMDKEGDLPGVLEGYAAQVVAGHEPEGYREGLGCS